MREYSKVRQIDPGLVVVSADLIQPLLPRVLEPADVRCAGLAKFVVGVDAEQGAGAVGDRDDAAALVGAEELAVGSARALVPDDRVVASSGEHEPTLQRVAAVIFGDGVGAVIGKVGRGRATDNLGKPLQLVICQRDAATRAGEQILTRVAVGLTAGRIGCKIAL